MHVRQGAVGSIMCLSMARCCWTTACTREPSPARRSRPCTASNTQRVLCGYCGASRACHELLAFLCTRGNLTLSSEQSGDSGTDTGWGRVSDMTFTFSMPC